MKKIVQTNKAPAPIGPYNQAVWAGNMLFLSGQIAIDPENGSLLINDLQVETHQVMKNIEAILKDQQLTFSDVIKSSIFLSDMNNFQTVNEIYGSYFNAKTAPARETVEVSCLPKKVNVEISIIAYRS